MIAAGFFNDRIILLRPREADERGEMDAQEVKYGKVKMIHANVKFLRGVEALTVAESWMQKQISVTIRDVKAMTERWRVAYQGQPYTIDSFYRDEKNKTIAITATTFDGSMNEDWLLKGGHYGDDGEWVESRD